MALSLSDEAAAAVEELSLDRRFAPRKADLQALHAALLDVDDPQGWEKLALIDAFPSTSAIHVQPQSRADRGLAIAAAVSVFLPIAWTWYSLSRAATAYKEMLAAGGGDGASFLQLWVTGFGGRLASHHELIPVAMVSVALIAIAVLLIGLSRVLSARELHAEEQDFAQAEAELISALSLAQRALGQTLVSDAESIEGLVRRSVKELARAHQDTSDAARQMTQAANAAKDALEPLLLQSDAVLASAQKAAHSTSEAATQLGATALASEQSVARALVTLEAQVTAAARAYEEANAQALDRSQAAMTTAATELRDSAQEIVSACTSISDTTQQLGAAVAALPARLGTEFKGVVDGAASQIGSATAELAASVSTLHLAADRIDGALTMNQVATQSQVTELTQSRDALERIRHELEGLVASLSGAR